MCSAYLAGKTICPAGLQECTSVDASLLSTPPGSGAGSGAGTRPESTTRGDGPSSGAAAPPPAAPVPTCTECAAGTSGFCKSESGECSDFSAGTFFCKAGSRVCRRRAGPSSTDAETVPETEPEAPVSRRVSRNEVVTAGGDDFVVDVRRRRGDSETEAQADAAPQPDVDVITEDEPCADMEVDIPDADVADESGSTRRRRREPLFCLPLRLRVGANADGTPASIRLEVPERYTSRGVLPADGTVTLVPADTTARRRMLSDAAHLRRTVAGGGCATVTYDDAAGVVTGESCTPAEYVVVTASQSDVTAASSDGSSGTNVALIVGVVVGAGGGLALVAAAVVVAIKIRGRKVMAAPAKPAAVASDNVVFRMSSPMRAAEAAKGAKVSTSF
jgi:hypothetical protein